MGCGKTTVGNALARLLGRRFVDMDDYIASEAGMGIPSIFALHGEEYFRGLETRAAAGLSRSSGLVISVGGGAVLRAENVASLKSGGVIVFIDVPLEVIGRRLEGDLARPLLSRPDRDEAMKRLFESRLPIYRAAADLIVQNADDAPAEAVAELIISGLGEPAQPA